MTLNSSPISCSFSSLSAWARSAGVALAAQEAGLATLGYTSQARFLMNCGIVGLMEQATPAERTHALKLLNEHEMGELFKVIALSPQTGWEPLGFASGDRSHTL